MSNGWILDTGAVLEDAQRQLVVAAASAANGKNMRIVLPTHVLMELTRLEVRYRRRNTPNPAAIKPDQVFRDLKDELAGVDHVAFTGDDAVALLQLLDTKPDSHWDEEKLIKAISDAWPPTRGAFLDLKDPRCGYTIRDCTCSPAIWRKDDQSVLKSAAEARGRTLARDGKGRASSTIDWLTIGMARRHDLTPVTRDKYGHEWRWISWISPSELAAAVRAAP